MTSPAPIRSPTEDRNAEIQAEAVHQYYQVITSAAPLILLLPLLPFIVLWPRIDHLHLITWFVATVSAHLSRYVLTRCYQARQPAVEHARRWANAMSLAALAEGVMWGIAGLLFLLPDSVPHETMLLTMLVGMSAGAIFSTSFWPRSMFAFAVPALGLTTLGLVWQESAASLGLAGALMVYLVILKRMTRQANRTAMRAIGLRFENLDLIAQLRVQKEAAEQANIAKSKFLAAASHDLRQPLHALGLFSTALNERIRYPEVRSIVGNINRCVAALGSLFEALLDISRLDAGVVELKRVHFALCIVLERLAVEYEPQARAQGLTFEIAGGEQVLYSDPALVERILRNLIVNAIRYTPQGSVRVDARKVGGQVEITVHDTGSGIPPDKREVIFHEFVQLANPERDRTKGLGLGLAIVRRLAMLLDGTVTVASEVGGGSLFRVQLPSGDPSAVATEVEDAPVLPTQPFADWLIVVIDDEQTIREAMQVILEGWGCVTVAAEDAAGAVSALRTTGKNPDAIVADYRLREGATGAQAIDQIQAEFGTAIPAFIITGDTAPERLQEARASGYLLLHKPVQPGKLRAVLASLQRTARGKR
jgi:signal transduction histidine kinase/CheY-like chemotaxis protein